MDIAVKRFYISLVIPGITILLMWLVFISEQVLHWELAKLGIFPRDPDGLIGVLLAPFIHGDLKHLMANSFPLLVLMTTLFYFYRNIAYQVLFLAYLTGGIITWFIAREAYHIGASGLLYGLAGFLTLSGLIRKHIGLIAISLIVIFQYGSMIWGIFPLEERVSWESHLAGFLVGLILAWIYRKRGPVGTYLFWQRPIDEDEDEDVEDVPWDEYEVEGPRKPGGRNKQGNQVETPDWESDWTRYS